jgi:lysophospholipase L1-like esterase
MRTLLLLLLAIEPRRESIEWCDAWLPHMKDTALPRVMLIGDSITRGYYAGVEQRLKDKAYVARLATSKGLGDAALLDEVKVFLGQARFDVVHLNIGMHGWDYSEAEYRKHLPALVKTVRKYAPGAKLIWAQTTPIRKDFEKGAQNARIEERNRIAREYCQRSGIPVDDLHALMKKHGDKHSDDIHFNKAGNEVLAEQVAGSILPALSSFMPRH